jgi:hypothetical protein
MKIITQPKSVQFFLWLAFAAVLFSPQSAAAQSAPGTDDTSAQSRTPGDKAGDDPFLVVTGPGTNSYVRFNLSVLPGGQEIR